MMTSVRKVWLPVETGRIARTLLGSTRAKVQCVDTKTCFIRSPC